VRIWGVNMTFSKANLKIDPSLEISRISDFVREMTLKNFKRKGAVIGLSGGIDSAVVAELCVRSLGEKNVLGLILPEKESNPVSSEFGRKHAEKMGIETITVDITQYLESCNVYQRKDAVIKKYFPEYDDSYRFHITLPQNLLEKDRFNYHSITIEDREGVRQKKRISGPDWLKISACFLPNSELTGFDSFSGRIRPSTFFSPNERTQSSATTAESIPPLRPITAPFRLKFLRVISLMKSEIREISNEGSIFRFAFENIIFTPQILTPTSLEAQRHQRKT
jgi:hypothetical protein